MPAERVAMRVVREVLHLTFAGISKREVARRTGLASNSTRIQRVQSRLDWKQLIVAAASCISGATAQAQRL